MRYVGACILGAHSTATAPPDPQYRPTDRNRTHLADRRRITAIPRLRAIASPAFIPIRPDRPDSSPLVTAPIMNREDCSTLCPLPKPEENEMSSLKADHVKSSHAQTAQPDGRHNQTGGTARWHSQTDGTTRAAQSDGRHSRISQCDKTMRQDNVTRQCDKTMRQDSIT